MVLTTNPEPPDNIMSSNRRVALLIDSATTWGAGLVEGIVDYAHANSDWHISLGPFGKYDRMLLPDHWRGEGVVARIAHGELATQISDRGIPAVDVSWYRYGGDKVQHCTCDEVAVAEMAATYFIDKGFRQFAYCGSCLRPNFVDHLGDAFEKILRSRTFTCMRYTPRSSSDGFLPPPDALEALIVWLRQLPKPVALLAFDALQGRQITDACQVAGIKVPTEVAVLGGEHDHLSCRISRPPLSSVDHDPYTVGWTAARLLADLMQGSVVSSPVLLRPLRIIAQQSTDTVAVNDDLLRASIRYIREHHHKHMQVSDILNEVPISRRALEKGFRKCLGRSPAEEIRRVRIEHAIQLLCDTAWPMPKIANSCGFERSELLTRAFRRELKTTPSAFRKRHFRERNHREAT